MVTERTAERFRVGAVQMNSGPDKAHNIERATALIERAAKEGADFIALPEEFNFLGNSEDHRVNAEPIPGPTINALADEARRHGVYLLAGSILESIPGSDKVFNTSVLLGPDGREIARYRKIHLFDIDVGETHARESNTKQAGCELGLAQTDLGRFGLSICYDLRFPELFRSLALAGSQVIFLPAAFSLITGKDHWEILLRARAVENGLFMVAPGQVGPSPGFHSYGSTMIVDPWGTVIARASDHETVVVADLDLSLVSSTRNSIPALQHRRTDTYRI